jgi:two-component system NtrC family sensor kinase
MAGINQQKQAVRSVDLHKRAHELLPDGTLGLLFEKSPDAILLVDGDVLVDCNPAAVEMFRYSSKSELLSTGFSKLSPPFQPDGLPSPRKATEMIAMAVERGSHRFEWRGKRSDESEFPVEVLLTVIPVEDGHILYNVWRDISRRKGAELDRSEAEEALLTERSKCRTISLRQRPAALLTSR